MGNDSKHARPRRHLPKLLGRVPQKDHRVHALHQDPAHLTVESALLAEEEGHAVQALGTGHGGGILVVLVVGDDHPGKPGGAGRTSHLLNGAHRIVRAARVDVQHSRRRDRVTSRRR